MVDGLEGECSRVPVGPDDRILSFILADGHGLMRNVRHVHRGGLDGFFGLPEGGLLLSHARLQSADLGLQLVGRGRVLGRHRLTDFLGCGVAPRPHVFHFLQNNAMGLVELEKLVESNADLSVAGRQRFSGKVEVFACR